MLLSFIGSSQCPHYPPELHAHGLNEELFISCFHAFEAEASLPWQVKDIPSVGFYKALHPYLTKQFKSSITKVTIGKFYIAIDPSLRAKGSRPDNIYRFIETVIKSKKPSDMPMFYGKSAVVGLTTDADYENHEAENYFDFHLMKDQLIHCTNQLEDMTAECLELKRNFQASRNQLQGTKAALRDITNEKLQLEK